VERFVHALHARVIELGVQVVARDVDLADVRAQVRRQDRQIALAQRIQRRPIIFEVIGKERVLLDDGGLDARVADGLDNLNVGDLAGDRPGGLRRGLGLGGFLLVRAPRAGDGHSRRQGGHAKQVRLERVHSRTLQLAINRHARPCKAS
jgi:hypothetical protein